MCKNNTKMGHSFNSVGSGWPSHSDAGHFSLIQKWPEKMVAQELCWLSCVVLALSLLSSLLPSKCLKADKTVIRWYGVGGSSTWIKASRCILRSSASRTTVLVKSRILPMWRWGSPQNWEVRKGGEGNRRSRCHRQLWCRWQQRQEGDTGTPWANQAVVSLQPPCHRQLVLCILGGGIED